MAEEVSEQVNEPTDEEKQREAFKRQEEAQQNASDILSRGIQGQGACEAGDESLYNSQQGYDAEDVKRMMREEAVAGAIHTFHKQMENRGLGYDDLVNLSVTEDLEEVDDIGDGGSGLRYVYTIRALAPEEDE